jgi:hypothetical protein
MMFKDAALCSPLLEFLYWPHGPGGKQEQDFLKDLKNETKTQQRDQYYKKWL